MVWPVIYRNGAKRQKLWKQAVEVSTRMPSVFRTLKICGENLYTVCYCMEVLDLPYFLVCRKTQNSGHFWSLPVHFYSLPVHFWITSGRHFRLKMLVTSGSYLVTSGILLVTSGPFPVVTSGSKFWSLPVHFR